MSVSFADNVAKPHEYLTLTSASQTSKLDPCSKISDVDWRNMRNGQSCRLSDKAELRRVEIRIPNSPLTVKGWKLLSVDLDKDFKNIFWIDFDPHLRGKSLAAFKAFCQRHGTEVPDFKTLQTFADAGGFLILQRSVYMKSASQHKFDRVHIFSETTVADNKAKTLNLASPDREVLIDANRGASDVGAVDASVCIRNDTP